MYVMLGLAASEDLTEKKFNMVRLLFSSLLAIHGLIHLMGFSKEWQLGPVSMLKNQTLLPLSHKMAKVTGTLWLLASLILILGACFYIVGKNSVWILALIGIGLSQVLIIIYWYDAKYGTIVNIIILLVVVVNIARVNFQKSVTAEITRILSASSSIQHEETLSSVETLPTVVQKWLRTSGSINIPPSHLKIIQKGEMRMKPDGSWIGFDATQFNTIDPPAFVWNSQVNAGALVTIAGRDKFEDGKGNMLIKPLFIYPLANSSGDEIDQGAMIRYMSEIAWYPEAAHARYFQWQELDSTHAQLTMTYGGLTASGIFSFDAAGLIKSFSAQRFGDFDGEFRKEVWEVIIKEHKEINNHLIPNKCEVKWKLKDGDFTWLRLEVMDIVYN